MSIYVVKSKIQNKSKNVISEVAQLHNINNNNNTILNLEMNTRSLVLQSFKKLHRTRMKVFEGDERALIAARLKINAEYHKNKHVTDTESIKMMIKLSQDVERELRTQVIQAREVKPGVFKARITEDTVKFDNILYDDKAVLDDGTVAKIKCCQDQGNK